MANAISLADVILRNKKIGQKNVDPFPDFNFWDWLKRSARQVADQASQTWNSGGVVGDLTRAYAAAQDQYGADKQTLSLLGLLLPEKAPPAPAELREPTNFKELPTNKGLEFIGQTIGDPINYVGPAIKYLDASKAAAEGAIGMSRQPGGSSASQLIVYHGSPHKFDKLDSAHIGKGEGAQAYGHGLYLSETPSVARTYKTAGSNNAYSRVTGGMSPMQEFAFDLYSQGRNEDDVFSAMYQKFGKFLKTDEDFDAFDVAIKSARDAQGYLYTIDLPDDMIARMLDWDKPLREQAANVQSAARAAMVEKGIARSVSDYVVDNKPGRDALSIIGRGQFNANLLPPDGPASAATSATLRNLGVPGIRYLDGGSRGAGHGTSNFVVFPGEEGRLTILERNGEKLRDVLLK